MSRTEVRAWGRHLGWIFHLDEQPALTATAETVAPPAQIVHYHLHLPPGTDVSGLKLALPAGSAVTSTEEE